MDEARELRDPPSNSWAESKRLICAKSPGIRVRRMVVNDEVWVGESLLSFDGRVLEVFGHQGQDSVRSVRRPFETGGLSGWQLKSVAFGAGSERSG